MESTGAVSAAWGFALAKLKGILVARVKAPGLVQLSSDTDGGVEQCEGLHLQLSGSSDNWGDKESH